MIMDNLDDIFEDDLELEEFNSGDTIAIETNTDNDEFFNDEEFLSTGSEQDSVISRFLQDKGIVDNKIKIIDENGEEQEIDFFSLSSEEQLDILNTGKVSEPTHVNDQYEGAELIQYLQENSLTLDQFLENYKNSILETAADNVTDRYEIDAYDDEELYMLDLKNKFDLTDEELIKELEKELQDSELFKKKADMLRLEYKTLEDQYKETQKQEFERQQQEQYDNFAQRMVDVAIATPEFYGIELEDNDKNEVLSFLLDLDDNGISSFYKALNDPNKLYEAAWFLRYGKESFDMLRNAYESEIAKLKKDKPTTVIRRSDPDKPKNSIHDLF